MDGRRGGVRVVSRVRRHQAVPRQPPGEAPWRLRHHGGRRDGGRLCEPVAARAHVAVARMDSMKAEVIAVGSELLGSTRADTNSLFLSERLSGLGIDLR